MNKKLHYLLIGVISLVLLGKANHAYSWISSKTYYYNVAYCVNETGKGTVYAKGPKVSNNSNSEVEFTRTSRTNTTNAIMSKMVFDWFVAPDNVDMYYSLYAENSHEDYQFDHWEKKNGNSWDIIKDENQNPIISPQYDAPKVNVTNTSTNPSVSATYRACFSLKGVLKVEIAEGQENLGHVTNSNVNNKAGDEVTISAQSTQSFQGVFFSHWTIDGNSTFESKENPLTVTVPEGVTSIVYRAHFTEPSELTYCRFENVGTGKFLSLSSTSGATLRQVSQSGGYKYTALEINALKLLSNTSSSMGDPSTVFYIGGTSDNAEGISPITVLQSQGENVLPNFAYGNDNRPVKITKAGQYFRISKIMTVNSEGETGEVYLNDEGTDTPVFSNAQGNNALWKIHFLDEGHIDEHAFGVAPDARMFQNGKYYTTLYTKFPYKMLDGIKAYYLDITKPDQIYNEQSKKITFLEVPEDEKIIPKNMAVILECSGTNPEGNRLLPIVDKNNSISEGKYVTDKNNLLKGALVVGGGLTGAQAADKNNLRQDYVYVYSSKNGLVSFYKWTGTKVIPNNKVYLAVTKNFEGDSSSDGNAAKGYTFVWGTTTGIDNTVVKVEEDGAIYNLQGSKVTNPSAGVYIKSGKKIIVK
jgi:hypothetical protein